MRSVLDSVRAALQAYTQQLANNLVISGQSQGSGSPITPYRRTINTPQWPHCALAAIRWSGKPIPALSIMAPSMSLLPMN
ncbi:MAG: lipase [Proteobacteria bacterium]|nr:lipase [Pseudomonadota bacterium]